MNVAIFGAGYNGRRILEFPRRQGVEIVAMLDNDVTKIGTYVDGVPVISPDDLKRSQVDKIIISNTKLLQSYEGASQLIKLGFPFSIMINACVLEMSEYMDTEMDKLFILEKKDRIPFKKGTIEKVEDYGYVSETQKAYDRRKRENFFEKYCVGEGLDIGYGPFLIKPDVSGWEYRNGDAQYLDGIEDECFDYVYSSHCLEHVLDVRIALENWFRVVKKGGYLIVALPDRDLYEKRRQLPSRWNIDHKHMFLIGRAEEPDTLDIVEEIRASLKNYDIQYIKRCDEGHTISDPEVHSDGEYQIEVVIRKKCEGDIGYI